MHPLLKIGGERLFALLRTRTGFLGFGPSYGEILVGVIFKLAAQKRKERSLVREVEAYLAEVNKRQQML